MRDTTSEGSRAHDSVTAGDNVAPTAPVTERRREVVCDGCWVEARWEPDGHNLANQPPKPSANHKHGDKDAGRDGHGDGQDGDAELDNDKDHEVEDQAPSTPLLHAHVGHSAAEIVCECEYV